MKARRRRTLPELLAGLGGYALRVYRRDAACYRTAHLITQNLDRPIDALLADQDQAIAAIVDHAYHHSPFYRQKFDAVGFRPGDVKGRADLALLPVTGKLELAQNVEDALCYPKEQVVRAETGGTTGIPLKFYRDRRCLEIRRGIDLATLRYYGWRDGQWQGWLWGASRDVAYPSSIKARLIQHYAERIFFVDALHLNAESYRHFVELTRTRRPAWISAYPSLAYDLARRIETGELEPFRVPLVNLTAEFPHDFQKQKIRQYWAEEVYERYGAREFGMAALECPAHTGLHYFTESVYFESTRSDPLAPAPRLFATDLLNYGMPLIRYDTGDYGEIDNSPCTCGRETPRLRNIRGRETDTIWCPDGRGIAGAMFIACTTQMILPAAVQVVQNQLDRITVRIAGDPQTSLPDAARLVASFKKEISSDLTYEIEFVDHIDRTPSGKFRDVISYVKPPMARNT